MLRVSGMRDEESGGIRYSILHGEVPADSEHLTRVAGLGNRLLGENGLVGSFTCPEPGVLVLDLPLPSRTFFHEGIVFAALDAFNDPARNVTINQPAVGDGDGGSGD